MPHRACLHSVHIAPCQVDRLTFDHVDAGRMTKELSEQPKTKPLEALWTRKLFLTMTYPRFSPMGLTLGSLERKGAADDVGKRVAIRDDRR